jgi:glycosyltransferase involved in cell wall biosynthesis
MRSQDPLRRAVGRVPRRVIRRSAFTAALRLTARGRRSDGVEVVIANWNSREQLQVVLEQVRRLSEPDLKVTVVDNGSTDGSRDFLLSTQLCEAIFLRSNAGHAAALDVGFLTSSAETLVALDSDAFPIRSDWLAAPLELLGNGATVVGARGARPFVHPSFLVITRKRFVDGRHSFRYRRVGPGDEWGVDRLDTGEMISVREGDRIAFLENTDVVGPGWLGPVCGGVVYHCFHGSRHDGGRLPSIDGITYEDAQESWTRAIERYVQIPDRDDD